ncbi:MAG TPA: beta-galactosidase [Firmicutes bacterium]|nr:beta-galactosidase [Bacillota bacterium]
MNGNRGSGNIYYGVDYYPEHCSRDCLHTDARLMQEAGFNIVRMAEFAWSKLEPSEGDFEFEWLDESIDILGAHGIKVVLGTPTAAPPAWIIKKDPDILPVDQGGSRMSFGGRRHYCPNNPKYHEHTRRIVEAMARHYSGNPNVIGWQIDNEFGGEGLGGRCYCEHCRREFIEWLKRKYSSLERLNEAWGTIFWSQTYTEWDEIPLPRRNSTAHNPSMVLDFYRFCSDSWVRYQDLQVQVLRAHADGKFITHNFMGLFNKIDYVKLARPLDFVAWDNYPRLKGEVDSAAVAMAHDVTRSLKGQPFWVMEEQSGPAGWDIVSSSPKPGEMRLWVYQAIAHGARGILYFRWDSCRYGTEQYWHGILGHDRIPGARYNEVKQVGEEIRRIRHLVDFEIPVETAILRSYDIAWAFDIQQNSIQFSYDGEILKYYRALFDLNIPVDVVDPCDADLSKYKLVVAPCLYLLSEELARKLEEFVEAGGTLILTYRSGVKNWNNVVTSKPLPGRLSRLVGARVEDYVSLGGNHKFIGFGDKSSIEDEHRSVEFLAQELPKFKARATVWCDILKPSTARPLAFYDSDYFAGMPAVTFNAFGRGGTLYVGTSLDKIALAVLVKWLTLQAQLSPPVITPHGVEAVRRRHGERDCYWFMNHNPHEVTIRPPVNGTNIIDGREVGSILSLAPYGVAIVEEEASPGLNRR